MIFLQPAYRVGLRQTPGADGILRHLLQLHHLDHIGDLLGDHGVACPLPLDQQLIDITVQLIMIVFVVVVVVTIILFQLVFLPVGGCRGCSLLRGGLPVEKALRRLVVRGLDCAMRGSK